MSEFSVSSITPVSERTLRDWPLGLSFIDTAWGCVACALAGAVGKLVADRVG